MEGELDKFLIWFTHSGGSINPSVSFKTFPDAEGGRGSVALADIPTDTTLFTLPRDLTLSTRTSSLPAKFGVQKWKDALLHKGWVGLILCMLWESTRSPEEEKSWSPYLDTLPDKFGTPMFWGEDELQELKGTAILDKIGKEDAERDYHEKLVPAIQSRPDLFPPALHESKYSLHAYHVTGSRILSRSFHVERWDATEGDEDGDSEDQQGDGDVSMESARSNGSMQVDEPEEAASEADEHSDSDSDGDDLEDPSDVAMVPVADLLNARCNAGNAKLFYEEKDLRMVSTKPIKAGEQIWNTYGDPPNSDLLRRYGHVDEISLEEDLGGGAGNPKDVVEIRADLIIGAIQQQEESSAQLDELKARINFWLEEGGEDVFVFEHDLITPPEVLSLIRLLLLPQNEWKESYEAKGKLPKPKSTKVVVEVLISALKRRIGEYPTTIQEDQSLLSSSSLTRNQRNAVIVRLGEKQILYRTMQHLEDAQRRAELDVGKNSSQKKRTREEKAGSSENTGTKKAKR